jgi:hypothetical protein
MSKVLNDTLPVLPAKGVTFQQYKTVLDRAERQAGPEYDGPDSDQVTESDSFAFGEGCYHQPPRLW